MSTTTESRPASLAERIAKVRNRMLVATLTGVPPSNKELFVALCQIYEEHDTEKSSFSSKLFDESSLLLQALSFEHETPEDTREQWPERILIKNISDRSENDEKWIDWDDCDR